MGIFGGQRLVILTCLLFGSLSCELFNSLNLMRNIPSLEKSLPDVLTEHIEAERTRLNELSSIVENLKRQISERPAIEDMEKLMGKPIHVYRFLTETYSRLSWMIAHVNPRQNNRLKDTMEGLPTEQDIHGISKALVRLMMIYPEQADFTNKSGLVREEDVLTTHEIFELIHRSLNHTDYHSALQLAYRVREISTDKGDEQSLWQANELMVHIFSAQGNPAQALKQTKELIKHYNETNQTEHVERLQQTHYILWQELRRAGIDYDKDHLSEVISERDPTFYFPEYETLCNGGKLDSITTDNGSLSCYLYTNNNHPLLILAPARVEQIHPDINLIFVHDVLTDSEIRLLKDLSIKEFEMSGIGTDPYNERKVDTLTRSSFTAWIADDRDAIIGNISGRVSAITGLSLKTAEMFQVLSYGIGGFYLPHFDWDGRENAFGNYGNRIATWIFYLNNVKKGGATAFPNIGAAVWPEKGGAAFWLNLHRNGTGNDLNLHAACPVLEGYKWVCNKWFHENDNEFTHPCGLRSDV